MVFGPLHLLYRAFRPHSSPEARLDARQPATAAREDAGRQFVVGELQDETGKEDDVHFATHPVFPVPISFTYSAVPVDPSLRR